MVKTIGEEANWCRYVTAVHLGQRKINASTAGIIIGAEALWQGYATTVHLEAKEKSVSNAESMFGNITYQKLMKSKTIYLTIILCGALHFSSSAQTVKFIKNQYQAKYRVFITDKPNEANQWIYRVSGPTDIRKPGEWYIVKNPQLFKQAVTLFKVDKKDDADIIVYYVSTRDSAKIFQ